ncbi:hypothetical protein LSAT2_028207, partial [Lamellibrachia satsuma]
MRRRQEIDETNKALSTDQVFKDASLLQGIARVHYVAYETGKTVHFNLMSDADSD